MPKIRVYLEGDQMRVETIGFQGEACKAASAPYEGLMNVVTDTPTAEMEAPLTLEQSQELKQNL